MPLRSSRLLCCVLAAMVASACDRTLSGPEPPAITDPRHTLTIVAGDQQDAPAGLALPVQPTVVVKDSTGAPAIGAEVLWRVAEGGGTVDATRTFTDSAGRTSVRWTLGDDVGTQLLIAGTAGAASLTFRATSSLYYTSVSAGWRHTCALDPRGLAWCWGNNQWGQLGNGTKTASVTSQIVQGRRSFAQLYAGMVHTCALTSSGEAWCWGDNGSGQLGDGTTIGSTVPVPVLGGRTFKQLSPGYQQTCGITLSGELYCWGQNEALPVKVVLGGGGVVIDVAVGETHTCAVDGQQRAFCWGVNDWGQLGIGSFGGTVATPTQVFGDARFTRITAGSRNTCALTASGVAYCWGQQGNGKLGTGDVLNYDRPTLVVSTGVPYVEIATGTDVTCARTAAGAIYCWGASPGNGTTVARNTPTLLGGGRTFTTMSIAGNQGCGMSNGIACWGSNAYGQLGLPLATTSVLTPTVVRPSPPAGT